jgi:hypothetical protein
MPFVVRPRKMYFPGSGKDFSITDGRRVPVGDRLASRVVNNCPDCVPIPAKSFVSSERLVLRSEFQAGRQPTGSV